MYRCPAYSSQNPAPVQEVDPVLDAFPTLVGGGHPPNPTPNCASSAIHGSHTLNSMNLCSNTVGVMYPLSQRAWRMVPKSVMPKTSHCCSDSWV